MQSIFNQEQEETDKYLVYNGAWEVNKPSGQGTRCNHPLHLYYYNAPGVVRSHCLHSFTQKPLPSCAAGHSAARLFPGRESRHSTSAWSLGHLIQAVSQHGFLLKGDIAIQISGGAPEDSHINFLGYLVPEIFLGPWTRACYAIERTSRRST